MSLTCARTTIPYKGVFAVAVSFFFFSKSCRWTCLATGSHNAFFLARRRLTARVLSKKKERTEHVAKQQRGAICALVYIQTRHIVHASFQFACHSFQPSSFTVLHVFPFQTSKPAQLNRRPSIPSPFRSPFFASPFLICSSTTLQTSPTQLQ